jgi:hypothetical protein
MPWHCPACHSEISHTTAEDLPRKGVIYRCHVCRLELTLDVKTNKLVITPLDADDRPRRA